MWQWISYEDVDFNDGHDDDCHRDKNDIVHNGDSNDDNGGVMFYYDVVINREMSWKDMVILMVSSRNK